MKLCPISFLCINFGMSDDCVLFSQQLKIYYIRYPLKITPLLSSHTSWNVAPRSMMRLSLYHQARRVLNL